MTEREAASAAEPPTSSAADADSHTSTEARAQREELRVPRSPAAPAAPLSAPELTVSGIFARLGTNQEALAERLYFAADVLDEELSKALWDVLEHLHLTVGAKELWHVARPGRHRVVLTGPELRAVVAAAKPLPESLPALSLAPTWVPKKPRVVPCKGCGAPVQWVTTNKGRHMPVNPERAVFLVDGLKGEGARVSMGRISHFATCPNRDELRRPRK